MLDPHELFNSNYLGFFHALLHIKDDNVSSEFYAYGSPYAQNIKTYTYCTNTPLKCRILYYRTEL